MLTDSAGTIVDTVNPVAGGQFVFDSVPAGDYSLSVNTLGYVQVERSVSVSVAATETLPLISLTHESLTELARSFTGTILLQGSDDHSGTSVEVQFFDSGQTFARAVTNSSGEFTLPASPNETLKVIVERDGYTSSGELAARGFSYVEASATFLDGAGASLTETLIPAPLGGAINVNVSVRPEWIPAEQRYVRVTLTQTDGGVRETIEAVDDADVATFSSLPAGRYIVTLSRSGFETIETELIELSVDAPIVNITPATVRLRRLSDSNIDLESQRLDACALRAEQVDLRDGDFSGTILRGAFGDISPSDGCVYCSAASDEGCSALELQQANFTNAVFQSGGTRSADLSGGKLRGANFFGAQLDGVDARNADFSFANLFAVSGEGAKFGGSNLSNTNFTSAQLRSAEFTLLRDEVYADSVTYTDASNVSVTVEHPWAGLKVPLNDLPATPCENSQIQTNLTGTTFSQADLTNAVFVGASLADAQLSDAVVVGGDLWHVCLAASSLNLTDLSRAVLDEADLSGTRMINSVLGKTQLRSTDLRGAVLTSAVIEQADFRPLGVISTRDGLDRRCEFLPTWSDYYGSIRNSTVPADSCSNGIDDDGDGAIDGDDAGCRTPERLEDAPACLPGAEDESCGCRTSLYGANLNGANLVGAIFKGADLTDSSALGISVGRSQDYPLVRPDACRPTEVYACIQFCEESVAEGSGCGVTEFTENIDDCEESWNIACRKQISPVERVPFETWSCFNDYLSERANLCDDFADFIPNGIYGRCELEIYGFDPNSLDPALLATFPPVVPSIESPCSDEAMRATYELNLEGLTCEQELAAPVWDCCPEKYLDEKCLQAPTSFENARLSNATLSGVVLSGVLFSGADLSELNFDGGLFNGSTLTGANLKNAQLTGVRIVDSELNHADLSNALGADAELRGSH